jgi:hypothetical protein
LNPSHLTIFQRTCLTAASAAVVNRDMTETKQQEHVRLQRRTDELKREHAALSRHRAPFNQTDHDKHVIDLAAHKVSLSAHKARPDKIKRHSN